jgi:hypothetical protein
MKHALQIVASPRIARVVAGICVCDRGAPPSGRTSSAWSTVVEQAENQQTKVASLPALTIV